ncbi:hypothetical protein [Thermoactinomyces sp. DSM 45891]|uniref:hypothetical protein n=1 Tax=Thermoactinomyces sp. DSM 45891 TaxID=1761907 RepID=UPI000930CE36|nr:hypothetical protein [Thermoactinomyces sp. DSM 45891]
MRESWKQVKSWHKSFGLAAPEEPQLLPEDRVKQRIGFMQEELQEFAESQTLEDQADAMIDLMYFSLGTLVEMGVDPGELFDIVHRANMSKLWEDGKPRYRESDGKVMKPEHWQDPQPLLRKEIFRQIEQKKSEKQTSL